MLVADTDVVSYLFKRHVLASRYEDLLEGHVVLLSFMTVAEIEYGMHSDGWGAIRRDAMRSYLESRFTTVYPDTKTIQVWATLVARCESRGSKRFVRGLLDRRDRFAHRCCPRHSQRQALPPDRRSGSDHLLLTYSVSPDSIPPRPP